MSKDSTTIFIVALNYPTLYNSGPAFHVLPKIYTFRFLEIIILFRGFCSKMRMMSKRKGRIDHRVLKNMYWSNILTNEL